MVGKPGPNDDTMTTRRYYIGDDEEEDEPDEDTDVPRGLGTRFKDRKPQPPSTPNIFNQENP